MTASASRMSPTTDIDPSFIFLSPTALQRSNFVAATEEVEPVEPRVIEDLDWDFYRLWAQDNAERYLHGIRNRLRNSSSLYDRLFEVMRGKRYRANTMTQTRFADNHELWRSAVEDHLREGSPLQFVLPSFPFKHANPFKDSRRSPAMPEVLCLTRLYEICQAIQGVYTPGARFVIIADGQVYHRMFGITRYEAVEYREETKRLISRLGYGDELSVVDMADLVDSRRDEFDRAHSELRPRLHRWWADNPDSPRRRSLVQNSATNINTQRGVAQDLVTLATKDLLSGADSEDLLANLATVRDRIARRAEWGAFEFALFLYTLREIDLVRSCYPRAVRATVHPKPGQWGLHLVNEHSRIFPWHGVAYHKADGQWRMRYESQAQRAGARPVHLAGDLWPFYYEAPGERGAER